jgi:hypothetical protein
MGNLRPIGSEKLQGMDKIRRIIEISRYKENTPNSINETKSTEYSIELADGNTYQIIKEKAGYIIKKAINESENEYIAPMKNRQYYPSYSQAFKRMNLVAKEINTLFENEGGTSLFNENKKYYLKRKPTNEDSYGTDDIELDEQPTPGSVAPAPVAAPAPAPVAAPAPSPAPAPEVSDEPEEDMPNFDEMGSDEDEDDDEPITMKVIQKLTGKLAQKIRTFNNSEEEDMSGDDVKYVINSVLSSLDLASLNDDDIDEIIDRLEGTDDEEGMGNEPEMDDDLEMGGDPEMGSDELPATPVDGGEMKEVMSLEDALNEKIPSAFTGNMKKELNMGDNRFNYDDEEEDEYPKHGAKVKQRSYPHLSHGTFGESKIDKIISKYFGDDSKKPLLENENKMKTLREMKEFDKSEVIRLSETIRQERSSLKYMEKNPNSTLIGVTNKKNLVFNDGNGLTETRITPNGQVL